MHDNVACQQQCCSVPALQDSTEPYLPEIDSCCKQRLGSVAEGLNIECPAVMRVLPRYDRLLRAISELA